MENEQIGRKGVRVYIAGPEVFLYNAIEMGAKKKALCGKHGLYGVYPFDVEVVQDNSGITRFEMGVKIGGANEGLIDMCDFVVANMTPFRGPSADVGTANEIGFAKGLGKVIFAYSNTSEIFLKRSMDFIGEVNCANGRVYDANGMAIEEWDMHDNLMLESAIIRSGGELVLHNAKEKEMFTDLAGFEICLEKIKIYLDKIK